MKNIKVSWTDLFVASSAGEPTEETAASNIQVVSSSYVCLVHNQMCHTQNSSFVKMKLINTCFRTCFLSKDFFKFFLINFSFLVMVYLRKHFHQKLVSCVTHLQSRAKVDI